MGQDAGSASHKLTFWVARGKPLPSLALVSCLVGRSQRLLQHGNLGAQKVVEVHGTLNLTPAMILSKVSKVPNFC